MLPCFVCVEFGTNSEVTILPCINKPVYELIVQIKRPLVFLGYLFWRKKDTFSSLLFLLVCLFFLAKQITSMYSVREREREREQGWGVGRAGGKGFTVWP